MREEEEEERREKKGVKGESREGEEGGRRREKGEAETLTFRGRRERGRSLFTVPGQRRWWRFIHTISLIIWSQTDRERERSMYNNLHTSVA